LLELFSCAEPVRRKISECIALMPADSTATVDPDFAMDVEAAIAAHREPLERPLGTDARMAAERRGRRQRFRDELFTGVPMQPVTVPIAVRAGQIDGRSQAKGVRWRSTTESGRQRPAFPTKPGLKVIQL
jgi:hypothetical protein